MPLFNDTMLAKIDKQREHRTWRKKDQDGQSGKAFQSLNCFNSFLITKRLNAGLNNNAGPMASPARVVTQHRYAVIPSRKPMPYRCKECRKHFSVRVGTVMQDSNLGLQKWVIAIYMMTVGIKGTSSMRLHRALKMTQATAWHLMQRIRQAFVDAGNPLTGPVEVDETFIGGKEANRHASKKSLGGKWLAGKYAVVGMKSRETKAVKAQVIAPVSSVTLHRFVTKHTNSKNTVYSDQNPGYLGLRKHGYTLEQINHSVKEYVNGQAHTNGIESFWAGVETWILWHLSQDE